MFAKAVELYESGMTQSEVATELGTTQKVIWSMFKRNGYKSRVAKKRNQFGEKNDSWKGNKAGYAANHIRVQQARGANDYCVMCDSGSKCQWANVSGRYDNVYDYIRLCVSCHSIFDNKKVNLSKKGGDINESI